MSLDAGTEARTRKSTNLCANAWSQAPHGRRSAGRVFVIDSNSKELPYLGNAAAATLNAPLPWIHPIWAALVRRLCKDTMMNSSLRKVIVILLIGAFSGSALPQTAEEWYGRGVEFLINKDIDKAIAAFTNALALDPDDKHSVVTRGVCYMFLNQFEKANADFTRAIALDPNMADAYFNRAQVYRLQGEAEKALYDFISAARLGDKKAQEILAEAGISWQ